MKSLKNCFDSSGLYMVFARFGIGSSSACAREEDDVLMPGGGGVGYAVDGAECWKTECAKGML